MKLGRKGAGLRRYRGKLEGSEWGRLDQNTSFKILKQKQTIYHAYMQISVDNL